VQRVAGTRARCAVVLAGRPLRRGACAVADNGPRAAAVRPSMATVRGRVQGRRVFRYFGCPRWPMDLGLHGWVATAMVARSACVRLKGPRRPAFDVLPSALDLRRPGPAGPRDSSRRASRDFGSGDGTPSVRSGCAQRANQSWRRRLATIGPGDSDPGLSVAGKPERHRWRMMESQVRPPRSCPKPVSSRPRPRPAPSLEAFPVNATSPTGCGARRDSTSTRESL